MHLVAIHVPIYTNILAEDFFHHGPNLSLSFGAGLLPGRRKAADKLTDWQPQAAAPSDQRRNMFGRKMNKTKSIKERENPGP